MMMKHELDLMRERDLKGFTKAEEIKILIEECEKSVNAVTMLL